MKQWMDALQEHAVQTIRYVCRVILFSVCLAGILLITIDMVKYLFRSQEFIIQTIHISGNQRVLNEEILVRADIAPGANIWLVDLNAISLRIEEHPAIANVRVQRVPPHQIEIMVDERSPIAFIENPDTRELHGVDLEGVVLEPMLGSDLVHMDASIRREQMRYVQSAPLLSGSLETEIIAGQQLTDDRIRSSLERIHEIQVLSPELYSQIVEWSWDEGETIRVYFRQQIGFLVLRKLDAPNLARKLTAFWDTLTANDLRALYVDARFPALGFAVRWDSKQGEQWKTLYRKPRSITYSGNQNP